MDRVYRAVLLRLLSGGSFIAAERRTPAFLGSAFQYSLLGMAKVFSLQVWVVSDLKRRSTTKTGLQTDLVAPDVSFEPIFIQEQIIFYLQKMCVFTISDFVDILSNDSTFLYLSQFSQ